MDKPFPLPAINIVAFNGFSAVSEKLWGLHQKQFKQEGVILKADTTILTKIAIYHICLAYALLLRVELSDPVYAGTENTWKEDHNYVALKKCASANGIDLDSIISNTI